MTAKPHQSIIGIGITYFLSKLHDIWWKTELALIVLSFKLIRASVYYLCDWYYLIMKILNVQKQVFVSNFFPHLGF